MDLERFQNLDIIVVCGLPGSGKSHFAGAHFSGSGRLRVNRKELRRLLFEMTHFGQKWSEKEFRLLGRVPRRSRGKKDHRALPAEPQEAPRRQHQHVAGVPQALRHDCAPGGEEHRRDLPRYARSHVPRAQPVPRGFDPGKGHFQPRGRKGASRDLRRIQGSFDPHRATETSAWGKRSSAFSSSVQGPSAPRSPASIGEQEPAAVSVLAGGERRHRYGRDGFLLNGVRRDFRVVSPASMEQAGPRASSP